MAFVVPCSNKRRLKAETLPPQSIKKLSGPRTGQHSFNALIMVGRLSLPGPLTTVFSAMAPSWRDSGIGPYKLRVWIGHYTVPPSPPS